MTRLRLSTLVLALAAARASRGARGRGQQLCKVCGRPQDEVDYTVAHAAWAAVVPAPWDRWAVCLSCFDRFATERGVQTVKVFLVNGP